MAMKRAMEGLYSVAMGTGNAYLIEAVDGLTLVDAGFSRKEAAVFGTLLKHLILTHGHPDHIGSAAAIVRETGAQTYRHPIDIPLAENGGPFRALSLFFEYLLQ
jgi:glyoxylase-like metal-dependent hydrolase (beta-lactamase superfamily II)